MRNLITIILLFFTTTVFPQDFSNKGKDFWIAYPAHIDGASSAMGIYITSDVNATGTITVGGQVLSFNLTANSVVRKFIGPNANGDAPNTSVYLATQDGIVAGAGIHVVSDRPVAVYAHIIRSARSGATLVLPTNVWGKNYIAPSYGNAGNQAGYGEIAVMAKLPNTTIEITPRVNSRNGSRVAGVPYQVTLPMPGDVYQVQFGSALDISGTTINSVANASGGCNPIAVVSATTWSALNCAGSNGGDNLYQQLFPVATWGKTFLTAPYIDRPYDIVRVFVSDPATVVKKTENGVVTTLAGLTAGNFYEYSTNNASQLEADKAISVVQYIVSQTCKTGCTTGGNNPACWTDPEMIILNPVEQTINNITVFSAHRNWVPANQSQVQRCLLNIIIKANATGSFTINGQAPAGTFTTIAGTGYAFLQEDITNIALSNPVQTLKADSAFSCIAYGFGNVESYGYNAGTNVRDLYQQVRIVSQYGTDPSPSACVNSPVKFKISLPYRADSLFWSFNGNTNQSPAADVWQVLPPGPVPNYYPEDSVTVVNGTTIYWYSLPSNYAFTAVGVYPVNVTVYKSFTDGCGNTQDIAFDLDVSAPPVADFYWQHNGCVNQTVQFRDTTVTSKPTYQWRWDFGDPASGAANVSDLQHPQHHFSAAGTYTVSYYTITTAGCISNTFTKQITVTLPPTSKFVVATPVCDGQPVTLVDSSAANGNTTLTQWYWDYGDGGRDTLTVTTNRTRTYTPAGTRTATLQVVNNAGCRGNIFTLPISVQPLPVASFDMPGGICLPADSARFVATSSISDGSQAGFTYAWDFGDALSGTANTSPLQNPSHYYGGTGPYTIRLTTTSAAGCSDDTTRLLSNLYPQAIAGVLVKAENCLADSSFFTSTSNGSGNALVKWYWDFGDGSPFDTTANPAHVFTTAGNKVVRHWAVTDKGCTSDTLNTPVLINPLPMANFSATGPFCIGREIVFTDASSVSPGNLAGWKWDFGDGSLLDAANNSPVRHTYTTTGNYQVSLTVSTSKGCTSSFTAPLVNVASQPVAGFILPQVCLNDTYALFTDTSTVPGGTIAKWDWNFGNPAAGALNTATGQNPQHSYGAVGLYTVSLVVTSSNGCTDTTASAFTVNGSNPQAAFSITTPATLCANQAVEITNTSSVFPGTISKVEIYWDNTGAPGVVETDPFPLTGKVYRHSYPNFQTPLTKTYTIRLRAYSGGVCVNDRLQNIVVNAAPSVQWTTVPSICPAAVPFALTQATETGGVPGVFRFDGAGITSAGIFSPAVVGPGTHRVLYTFTATAGGCMDTASTLLTVLPPPVAAFTTSAPVCVTQAVTFTDASSTPVGSIASYEWDFGDGSPLVNQSIPSQVSHQYASTGTFNASLRVTNDNGCTILSAPVVLQVKPLPVPFFSFPAVACLPAAAISFDNLSAITDGTANAFTYAWNFGDPASGGLNSSVARSPTHVYSAVGPFTASLTVTSGDGCRADTNLLVNTIHPQPVAAFTLDQPGVCLGGTVNLVDGSNGLDGSVTTRFWQMGDGQIVGTPTVNHRFATAGTYNISLYITNSFGCNSDTLVKPYIVHPYPLVNAGPDRVCLEGGSVTLQPVVTGNDLQYAWTPGRYLNSAVIASPTVVNPLADITYTLTVTARGGCVASDEVTVTLLLAPRIPNTFSPNGDGINERWLIRYLDSYPGCRIQVFTKAGQLVYEARGYSDATAWNGTLNGKSLPIDTYYYIIEPGSGRKPLTGYVTIVK